MLQISITLEYVLAYLERISTFSILLAYDRLECPVAPLSGASRPPRGPDNDFPVPSRGPDNDYPVLFDL